MATAKDLMSDAVRGVQVTATMREAIALLAHHGLAGLPVIDASGALQGMVSQYDILASFSDPALMDAPVVDHMTTNTVTLDQSDSIESIAEKFKETRVQRAPVVNGASVVGMVSRTDLVNYLAQFV
ncbi:Hypoxic response protein 1 [Posidoniimonas polymericola]|uniref:Hypoxic response protein 1 n=1 Tax=Posidoniimonas polymericola TaxID=2528002 RepID=A0A5C5YDM8_9BACT|nr:CBS domain-containing protein [Posidoniimonas polymericola]TWT73847.1 Hypoxic response protein 1 [Posidoniimonas polymericola]